jgi:hypothetical protein
MPLTVGGIAQASLNILRVQIVEFFEYFLLAMPEAKYSSTSYTVMRNPRMQGLPPRLSGSSLYSSWWSSK